MQRRRFYCSGCGRVAVAKLKAEFDRRNFKVIGLSVDPTEDHHRWADDIRETQGVVLNFPLIADHDRAVSSLYGMVHANAIDTFTVRLVFLTDPTRRSASR